MNIKFNKILCLLIFCNLFMSMGAVSAFDTPGHQHNQELLNTHNKSNNISVINQQTPQNNKSTKNILDTNTVGTFKELNEKIQDSIKNHQQTVELDKNYYYDEKEDNDLKNGIIIDENIIIEGNNHIIDGSGIARAFQTPSNASSIHITIKDITFEKTKSDNGGAIYFKGMECILSNCHFIHSNAESLGGAVYSYNGALNIEHTEFTENTAHESGGAIYSNKDITLNDCSFFNNIASENNGGSIYFKYNYGHTEININQCLFRINKAKEDGGAVYCEDDGNTSAYIRSSTFDENSCNGAKTSQCEGGAVYYNGHIDIKNSTFTNNKAEDYGGAMYSKTCLLNDCTFNNNTASDNDGGAVYCEGGMGIHNCKFNENKAYEDGGAICCYSSPIEIESIEITNSKFDKNSCNGAKIAQCEGGAIYCSESKNLEIHTCTFTNNHAYDYGGAIYAETSRINIEQSILFNNYVSDNDGGAVYLNNWGNSYLFLSHNNISSNYAAGKGGGIYSDVDYSYTYLSNNNLVNNSCGSNKGSVVYTDGYFNEINNNWWGTPTPNWDSGLLWENTFWSHNIHHDDCPRTKPCS
ncbi:MAG: right-handed parallel beta-helix repeat-containing protein [archaeon]|nr:right-handed parallel beta-helix repeat-containing protein [archaeon]